MTQQQQTETQTQPTFIPVGDIKIQIGNVDLIFTPAKDITGYDVAKLLVMFLNGIMAKEPINLGDYIAQHDLAKHFMLLQKDPPIEEKNT